MKIEIYTTSICPYCLKVKALLKQKAVEWIEYNIQTSPDKMREMLTRSAGKKTVPQVFINDNYIGGYDDLYALELKGELDSLLK